MRSCLVTISGELECTAPEYQVLEQLRRFEREVSLLEEIWLSTT